MTLTSHLRRVIGVCRRRLGPLHAPFFDSARQLMALGKLGELDLWMAASQFTDLIYILSNGGNSALLPSVLERLRRFRTFVHGAPVTDQSIDAMLTTPWSDPEDALLHAIANEWHADAFITRNGKDFETGTLKICNCEELFHWMQSDLGITYDFIDLS